MRRPLLDLSSPLRTGRSPGPRRAVDPAAGLDAIAPGSKVLWVTSTGGHLSELALLAERVGASDDSIWVTSETEQSVGFLQSRPHVYVDYVAPRDLAAAVRAARRVTPLLRRERFDACVSTGAAVAGTILPLAAWSGIPTYYVESLARSSAPSVTGKLLAHVPRVRTLTQHSSCAKGSWSYAGSTLDLWRTESSPAEDDWPWPLASEPRAMKILVTLGTIAPYRFDRAVQAVLDVLVPGDDVVWQLGSTTRDDLPGRVLGQVSPHEMDTLSREADVVVAHCGVGSLLQQLALGNSPVLAVRRSAHDEHVDDHQLELARTTADRGLASLLDLDRPDRQVLEAAAARVVTTSQPLLAAAV